MPPGGGTGPWVGTACLLLLLSQWGGGGAGGGCGGLNLGGPPWLVAGGAPGWHQHLGGPSRSSASRINGYISSLDARGPHQRGKLAGPGLACPALPEALRGASQLVSGPRDPPPREDRKWVPRAGCGSWQQRGAQKGERGAVSERRQQSAKGPGWEAAVPLPLQCLCRCSAQMAHALSPGLRSPTCHPRRWAWSSLKALPSPTVLSKTEVLPRARGEQRRIKWPHGPRAKETHAPEWLDHGPKGTLSHGPDL